MGLAFGLLKQALPPIPRSVPNAEKTAGNACGEEISNFSNLRDAGSRQSAVFAEESPVNSRLRIGPDREGESAQGSQRYLLRKAR